MSQETFILLTQVVIGVTFAINMLLLLFVPSARFVKMTSTIVGTYASILLLIVHIGLFFKYSLDEQCLLMSLPIVGVLLTFAKSMRWLEKNKLTDN